jgi:hypothetical protein
MTDPLIQEINRFHSQLPQETSTVRQRYCQRVASVKRYSWQLARYLLENDLLNPSRPVERDLKELFLNGTIKTYQDLIELIHLYPDLAVILEVLQKAPAGFAPYRAKRRELMFLTGLFIPIDIKDYVLEHDTNCCQYLLTVGVHEVEINLWSHPSLSETEERGILRDIVLAIRLLTNSYRQQIKPEKISLYYFDTPHRKTLLRSGGRPLNRRLKAYLKRVATDLALIGHRINPDKIDTSVSIREVNSALCNYGRNKYIAIWRREELTKVVSHELIHYFRLEKVELPDLAKLFKLNVSDTFQSFPIELITESQCWFLHLLSLKVRHGYTDREMRRVIALEQRYALAKIGQVLSHNGIDRWAKFWNGARPTDTINCHCSLVYYYILKALLVSRISETLLDLIVPNRTSTPEAIVKLVAKNAETAGPVIDRAIRLFNRGKGLSEFNRASLKMTLYG